MTRTGAEPGVSPAAADGSSPRRARAGSCSVQALGAVRAIVSAATPGTSVPTSTVRADGNTTPVSIAPAS